MKSETKATILLDVANDLSSKLIEIRRKIHENPELAYKESATSALAQRILSQLGYKIAMKVAGTGLIADLGEGEHCVAIRADMDAVALTENSREVYCSRTAGVMHACGHDAHVAVVLGAAELLAREKLNGKVRIIMQPAEESPDENGHRGSHHMINAGALAGVRAILGLHVDATLPAGHVGVINQPAADFKCKFNIAKQTNDEANTNFTELCARLLKRFYDDRQESLLKENDLQIVEVNCSNSRRMLEINGAFNSGDAAMSSCRAYLEELLDTVAGGAKLDLSFESDRNLSDAHAGLISTMLAAGVDVVGEDRVKSVKRRTWTNDFAAYAERIPASFLLLGAELRNSRRTQHTPTFDIDESALPIGAAVLARTAIRVLEG